MVQLDKVQLLVKLAMDFQPNAYYFGTLFVTFFLLVLLYAILVIVKYAVRRHKYSQLIPCIKVHPLSILGNLLEVSSKKKRRGNSMNVSLIQCGSGLSEVFKEQKLYCLWFSHVPIFVIFKAEAVEELISGTKNMEKGWNYKMLHPWLGTGLLTSHGSKWKSRRKLLTPSFHFEILKDFIPIFNEQSKVLVNVLRESTREPWINIVTPITLCTLDIICETTLGTSINAQKNKNSQYVQAVLKTSDIIVKKVVNPKYWVDWIFYSTAIGKSFKNNLKIIHDFTKSVIQEKKKRLISGEALPRERKRKALMDLLLEHHINNKDLTDEDIREEVDTFAFEGHDTTSMGISWALYLIGLHKDVQANIHEELDRIFGSDVERHVTTDDLKDMEYLERVLKESQRLYPSVPVFTRQLTEDITIDGYNIPKGITCGVYTYQLHRDKRMFPDPEKFDPDRFLPENSVNRHPYAYVPFSAGPRNCIGQRFAVMEEKVVISNILRNYALESLDPRDRINPGLGLILRAEEPLRIKIRKRHSNK